MEFYITLRFPIDKTLIVKPNNGMIYSWFPYSMLNNIGVDLKSTKITTNTILKVFYEKKIFDIPYSHFIQVEMIDRDLMLVLSNKQ
jgi:hypothetical protein